jgi:radial spoke head protein 9
MNVDKLDYELDFANNSGSTLNIEELTHLQLSVANLNANEKFDEVYFWGRIRGIDKDYYIVMGVRFKERVNFPERCFFWCNNNFVIAPLNPVSSEIAEFLGGSNGYFSGQHDKVLKAADVEILPSSGPVLENGKVSTKLDDKAIIERGNRPKAITELDRLSFTVQTIEHECAVVNFFYF